MTNAKKILLSLPVLAAAVALGALYGRRELLMGPPGPPPPALAGAPEPDLDLVRMSSTVRYSQIFDLMQNPAAHTGQVVRVRGFYRTSFLKETGARYHACFVTDAAACCQQGIEFVATNAPAYPRDYPDVGMPILVQGVVATYAEGGNTYVHLRDALLSFAAPAP